MANKYIRHGATYCGDGTSSALATSDGGVGAWNTINYFLGTAPAYGILNSGDKIYIKSKDESGNDISTTNTSMVYPGSSAGTISNLVTWVIDDGIIWPGVSGKVTITTSNTSGINCRVYNRFIAKDYNLVFKNTSAASTNATFFNCVNCFTTDIKVDTSTNISGQGFNHQFSGGIHIRPWILQGTVTSRVITWSRESDTTLISPKIDILGPLYYSATSTTVIGTDDAISSKFQIYGGELTHFAGASGIALIGAANYSTNLDLFGFKFPSSTPLSASNLLWKEVAFTATGCDGALGTMYMDKFFAYSSRSDGYYPTLNALLGLSLPVPWSYSIYPYRTDGVHPVKVPVSKLWTQTDATKTITFQFLWPTSMPTPNKSTVWMSIAYTDGSGNRVTQSGFDIEGSAVDASTAPWSAVTYGATLFNKFKLSITTSAAIKQDTEVIATFFSSPTSVSTNDIIVLCPDVEFA